MDSYGEWAVNPARDSIYLFFGPGGPTGHTAKVTTTDTVQYITGSYLDFNDLHIQGGGVHNVFSPFGNGVLSFKRCLINNAFNGITLYTINNSIYNSSIVNCLSNGLTGTSNGLTKYLFMVYDTLHNIGRLPGMGGSGNLGWYEGINNPADGCVYDRLEIDTVGYNAIYFGGDSSVVKNCHIKYVCFVKDDGAAIYTWRATTPSYTNRIKIDSNYVENSPGAYVGVTPDPASSGNGIYVDGRQAQVDITNNTATGFNSSGFFSHGSDILFKGNASYGNGYAQYYISEFTGIPVTGVILRKNFSGSPDSAQMAIRYNTPGTDIATMATADSNYYSATTGAVNTFWTRSSTDIGTKRSFASWKSTLSQDSHSSYQTNTLFFAANTTLFPVNRPLYGKYLTLPGVQYWQAKIPIGGLSGIILLQLTADQILPRRRLYTTKNIAQ